MSENKMFKNDIRLCVCVCVCVCIYIYIYKIYKGKGKVIPLQARCGPEGG